MRAWLSIHEGDGAVEEAEDCEVRGTGGECFALSLEGTHPADSHQAVGIGNQDNGDGKEDNQGRRSEDNGLSLGNVCTGKLEHKGDVTDIVVNDTGATEERLEDVPSQ